MTRRQTQVTKIVYEQRLRIYVLRRVASGKAGVPGSRQDPNQISFNRVRADIGISGYQLKAITVLLVQLAKLYGIEPQHYNESNLQPSQADADYLVEKLRRYVDKQIRLGRSPPRDKKGLQLRIISQRVEIGSRFLTTMDELRAELARWDSTTTN